MNGWLCDDGWCLSIDDAMVSISDMQAAPVLRWVHRLQSSCSCQARLHGYWEHWYAQGRTRTIGQSGGHPSQALRSSLRKLERATAVPPVGTIVLFRIQVRARTGTVHVLSNPRGELWLPLAGDSLQS
jgi:hypothetical protein